MLCGAQNKVKHISGSRHLRILIIHNAYQQAGGEDTVQRNEAELLRRAGHIVESLIVSNDNISSYKSRITTALAASYNLGGKALVSGAINRFRPDVVHVHNTFPRLSPSVFDACSKAGVPVVWTLHNFRITCANGILLRSGLPCEDCVGNAPLSAIRHRCYRGSAIGSASVAAMIWTHQLRGTWHSKVDRFIALTHFARDKFIAAGLPSERIVVKPNFSEDPLAEVEDVPVERRGALFVGRLSAEKGVDVLVDAWRDMGALLTIIGDGPQRPALEAKAGSEVQFLGHHDRAYVQNAMRRAALLVVPSVWFEMYPMTVVEAMACGTPVVASRIGALAEIVQEGVTGFHFSPGDAHDLSCVVRHVLANPEEMARIGANARSYYKDKLAPEANIVALERIYNEVIEQ